MVNKYDVTVDPSAPNNAHAFMVELVGWNRRVLELGAAAGPVTRALVDQDCRVTAVERDGEAAVQLKGIADEVIVGDLNDPTVFDGLQRDFDVLLLGDMLGQLIAPQEVLNRAARLVKPTGVIVMSIPNVAHADVRLALMLGKWDYRPRGLLDGAYMRFFTVDTLRQLLRRAGLVVTEIRRVRVPAFETELAIERTRIPTEVLDLILADPEAETYQFVVSAAADHGDYRLRRLSDRVLELERSFDFLNVANQALRAAQDAPWEVVDGGPLSEEIERLKAEREKLIDEREWLGAEREQLHAEIGRLHQQLDDAELARTQLYDELDTLKQTKTFRYTKIARQYYGRLLHHQ